MTLSRRYLLGAGAAWLGGGVGSGLAPALQAASPLSLSSPPFHPPHQQILSTPDGRALPLWRWRAATDGNVSEKDAGNSGAKAAILFSHGAASSPRHYERLFRPWAAAGYDIFAPVHVDATDHPQHDQFTGLASWKARIEDMWLISKLLGDQPYIAAGHSYGGLTAIAIGGGVSLLPDGLRSDFNSQNGLRDPRAAAVLAFSPPPAIASLVGTQGYAPLAVPSFHQTGTKDVLAGAGDENAWKDHLHAFDAAPDNGQHFALLLPKVDHYFGGLICKPDADGPPMESELHQAIALSLIFMDGAMSQDFAPLRRLAEAAKESEPTGLAKSPNPSGPIGLFYK